MNWLHEKIETAKQKSNKQSVVESTLKEMAIEKIYRNSKQNNKTKTNILEEETSNEEEKEKEEEGEKNNKNERSKRIKWA